MPASTIPASRETAAIDPRDDPGRTFHDVLVVPFRELMESPFGRSEHRGGPLWPDWGDQVEARHRRHGAPIDDEPVADGDPTARLDAIAWGGPLVPHFGHQIADFSMRVMPTLLARPDLPLAFSAKPEWDIRSWADTKPFFREIMDWFEVQPDRIVIIAEPTLVTEVVVFAQAEQLGGPGPSESMLDHLGELTGRRFGGGPSKTNGTVYVSRAGQLGKLAGESHLEHALRQAGVTILHPGPHRAATDELRAYHQAEHLIFAEGTAIHVLQLGGRIDADVSVIERRPGMRLASANIEPRARTLRYIQGAAGVVHAIRPDGQAALPTGISVLDEDKVIEHLAGAGVNVREHWDSGEFRAERDADVRAWLQRFLDSPRTEVPGAVPSVLTTLRATGLPHLADEVAASLQGRGVTALPSGPAHPLGTAAPWVVRRLDRLARSLGARRYLEVAGGQADGGQAGGSLADDSRVDAGDGRSPAQLEVPERRLAVAGSLDALLAPGQAPDLVYLSAMPSFDVAYRDLCAVLVHGHNRTAVLIDGTRPVDAYASARERQLAERLRELDDVPPRSPSWQGDVFKLVFALHDVHMGFDYRTITSPDEPQTLVWRSTTAKRTPRFGSLEAIFRLGYLDLLEHWDVMQACTEDEAIGACLSALARQP